MKVQWLCKTPGVLMLSFFLLFYLLPFKGYSQANVIKGTVRDERGTPMAGVSIVQKNGDNTATSAGDGSFSINVPAGSVLVFTYVGYASQELPVTGSNAINVVMAVQEATMNDVVVIG